MKKVAVIGHFGFGLECLDGQTIKTKNLTEELEYQYGEEQVIKIDTHGGIKTVIKAPFQVIKAFVRSRNIVMLPAHNGLRVYGPLLAIGKCLFSSKKIHYAVVGGWLPEYLVKRQGLVKCLKMFDGIYVETSIMKTLLEKQGFVNISVMPNCKKLCVLSKEELIYATEKPYKLCTFSRVMREKGIQDVVDAVIAINEKLGEVSYILDIYGPVDSRQTEWFNDLQNTFPEYIKYCGTVPSNESVDILKNYFALIFPTKFYTEGIPGTIIDAYAAGIPVICSRWESFSDVVEEQVTGFGYKFDNGQELEKLLIELLHHREEVYSLKVNCIDKATEFLPENVIECITSGLE